MDQQEAWRGARSVARGSINRLYSDLRVVEARGGLQSAVAGGQDFVVRVPYAFGIVCAAAGNTATVSLLPVDATMYSAPGHSGFAVRDDAGIYTYYTSATLDIPPVAGVVNTCFAPVAPDLSISTLGPINGSPAGQVVVLTAQGAPLAGPPKKGQIVFLYRRIRYQFKNSTMPGLAGRTGLFRTPLSAAGAPEEELAAPFANTARVNFYVLNNAAPQAAVPAPLSNTRGLELVLDGMSERAPGGSAAPKTANVRTSVFFENRPD
jgi:hypothetical protein